MPQDLLARFKDNDYSDDIIGISAFIYTRIVVDALTRGTVEMSPKDVDDLFVTLQMNAGQKIKFRRELKKRGLCQGLQ